MTQPDADQILGAIREFLTERFDIPAEKVSPDTSLRDLGLDSMMVMDVMMETEDRFGVKLMDLSLPRDPKLGDVVSLIERNLRAGA